MPSIRKRSLRQRFKEGCHYSLIPALAGAGLYVVAPSGAQADFAFNWQRDSSMTSITTSEAFPMVCGSGRTQVNNAACSGGDITNANNGTQPWVNELVRDANSNQYFHMIVGLPTDDFRQEVYIRIGATNFSWSDGETRAPSDSGGDLGIGASRTPDLGAGSDPLGKTHTNTFSGASTGNPKHVLMKQVLQDDTSANTKTNVATHGSFYQEFSKTTAYYTGTDLDARKPKIIQTLSKTDAAQGDISMSFMADMSAITYSDMNSPLAASNNMAASGVFVNTMTLTSPGLSSSDVDFDMSKDTQAGESSIDAGRFTFTPGTGYTGGGIGWLNTTTYNRGTYTYFSGGFDQFSTNYSQFCDPSQIKSYGSGANNYGC